MSKRAFVERVASGRRRVARRSAKGATSDVSTLGSRRARTLLTLTPHAPLFPSTPADFDGRPHAEEEAKAAAGVAREARAREWWNGARARVERRRAIFVRPARARRRRPPPGRRRRSHHRGALEPRTARGGHRKHRGATPARAMLNPTRPFPARRSSDVSGVPTFPTRARRARLPLFSAQEPAPPSRSTATTPPPPGQSRRIRWRADPSRSWRSDPRTPRDAVGRRARRRYPRRRTTILTPRRGTTILTPADDHRLEKLFVPAALNRHLRDYQREGVRFLYRLHAARKGGVLADDMGLGKTLQTIAFLTSGVAFPGGERRGRRTAAPRARRVSHQRARELGERDASVGGGAGGGSAAGGGRARGRINARRGAIGAPGVRRETFRGGAYERTTPSARARPRSARWSGPRACSTRRTG